MHLSTLFLSSLLAITTLALPSQNLTSSPSEIQRRGSDTCFQDCMDSCHPPAGAYAICELPCGLNCNLDFSHGYHYTETNLDDYVHNREGTLVCYNRVGS